MEELKKVFPESEIEVREDNERLTQYGIHIPMHVPVPIKNIANIDINASIGATSDGLYISVIIYKH